MAVNAVLPLALSGSYGLKAHPEKRAKRLEFTLRKKKVLENHLWTWEKLGILNEPLNAGREWLDDSVKSFSPQGEPGSKIPEGRKGESSKELTTAGTHETLTRG